MPVRFTWRDGEVYIPLNMASDQLHRYSPEIKLKPGITMAAAAAEFRPLYQQFDKQTPNVFPKQYKISVRGLADTYSRDLKETRYLLFGAVAYCSRSAAEISRSCSLCGAQRVSMSLRCAR